MVILICTNYKVSSMYWNILVHEQSYSNPYQYPFGIFSPNGGQSMMLSIYKEVTQPIHSGKVIKLGPKKKEISRKQGTCLR